MNCSPPHPVSSCVPLAAGVRVVQLMTWQQRLSALIGQRRLDRALLAAVRIYHRASQGGGAGGLPSAQLPLPWLCFLCHAFLCCVCAGWVAV